LSVSLRTLGLQSQWSVSNVVNQQIVNRAATLKHNHKFSATVSFYSFLCLTFQMPVGLDPRTVVLSGEIKQLLALTDIASHTCSLEVERVSLDFKSV